MILAQKTNRDGSPKVNKKDEPAMECWFKVAFPKGDPAIEQLRAVANRVAHASFPELVDANGNAPDSFAWKIVDGDSPKQNNNGKRFCDFEGYPGHWVVTFSTSFLVKTINQEHQPVTDPKYFNRGDYIMVQATIKDNKPAETRGLYINPAIVKFIGYGKPIQTGPNPDEVFGTTPVKLPPGCTTTPQASSPMPGQYTPQTPAAPMPAPAQQVAPPPQAIGANVQPAHDFVAGPPPAAPAPPAPAPATPEMRVYQGVAYPRAALEAQGWTAAKIDAMPLGGA
jgi:hypothetical protein